MCLNSKAKYVHHRSTVARSKPFLALMKRDNIDAATPVSLEIR